VTENPLVSVIVRTKDRPKLLKRALQSIADQTYRPIEVVLVNDGGCDLDIEEMKTILRDVSLNYIRLDKNEGRAFAGNVGIENAKGDYIGFLDDDDEFYPEHVADLVSFLRQSDYKIAYADSEIVFKEYNLETKEISETDRRIFSSKDFSFKDLLLENYIPLITIIFTRDVLISAKGFDQSLELYEDWELLLRCGQMNLLYHVKKVTSKYIQWSRELQIAQSPDYWKKAEIAYDMVVEKHKEKFTPEVIRYFRDSAYKIRTALAEKDNFMRTLEALLKDKDGVISDKDIQIKNLVEHQHRLEESLRGKEAYINDLHSGRGWRLLMKYYNTKSRILDLLMRGAKT
jgi:glycosyltransferase involved in cell wall biosynthesis